MTELRRLYAEIASLTNAACAKCTRAKISPWRCCEPEYCEAAIRFAREERGVELARTDHPALPLMGPHGCVAEPWLRPICSVHQCGIAAFGMMGAGDHDDERYYELREEITAIEGDLLSDEIHHGVDW